MRLWCDLASPFDARTGNNEVQELHDARIRCNRRTERGSVPFTRHGSRVRKRSQVRALFCSFPEHEIRESREESGAVPADQHGQAECATQFRQINTGKPNVHHDALEFPDGETVLLTRL
jgi:hypothetical protein